MHFLLHICNPWYYVCVLCLLYTSLQWEVLCVYNLICYVCVVCFVPAVSVVAVRSSLRLQPDVCFVPAVPVVAVRSSLHLQPDMCVVCFVPAVPVSCGELQWEVLFTGWSATTLNQDSPLSCQLPLSPFALCRWPAEVSVMRVISHHTVLGRRQAQLSVVCHCGLLCKFLAQVSVNCSHKVQGLFLLYA